MRSSDLTGNWILTASLLLLPALPAPAAPPGPVRAPARTASVSVRVDPRPSGAREVGAGRIVSWRAAVVVAGGRHLVTVTHTNAADDAAQPGVTHLETMELAVEAGRPTAVELHTWGPRPTVIAKITRSLDADPPARQPADDARNARERTPARQAPAAEKRPGAPPPAGKAPAAPAAQKRPAPGRGNAPPPAAGQKPGKR